MVPSLRAAAANSSNDWLKAGAWLAMKAVMARPTIAVLRVSFMGCPLLD